LPEVDTEVVFVFLSNGEVIVFLYVVVGPAAIGLRLDDR